MSYVNWDDISAICARLGTNLKCPDLNLVVKDIIMLDKPCLYVYELASDYVDFDLHIINVRTDKECEVESSDSEDEIESNAKSNEEHADQIGAEANLAEEPINKTGEVIIIIFYYPQYLYF